MNRKIAITSFGLVKYLLLIFIILFSKTSYAQGKVIKYINKNHTMGDVLFDQGVVFFGHTTGYYLTQRNTVEDEGSWDKYERNFGRFKLDNDNTNWNFFGHTYTGSQVYLYYRARGHSERKALFYSFLSSLYFEVLIENYTERPSFQDTFNTPLFGATLGHFMEKWSVNLIKSDNRFLYYLGRAINPFSYLIDPDDNKVTFAPYMTNDSYGVLWSLSL